jgi:hypothetical protein
MLQPIIYYYLFWLQTQLIISLMDGEGFKLISRVTEQKNVNLHILEKMVQSQSRLHNRERNVETSTWIKKFVHMKLKNLLLCHILSCCKNINLTKYIN